MAHRPTRVRKAPDRHEANFDAAVPSLSRYDTKDTATYGRAKKDTRTAEQKNPNFYKKQAKRFAPCIAQRSAEASYRQTQMQAQVKSLADELHAERSWLSRKEDAFLAYALEIEEGADKAAAYKAAAKMARVSQRTVRTWCPQYIENDGVFPTSTWGCNSKIPSVFLDTEIQLKSSKWWRAHSPKKGKMSPRMADFRSFLVGSGEPDEPRGLLWDVLESRGRKDISESQCYEFTHMLGFEHEDLRKGTFNDKHESEENQADRKDRFLPEYFKYYASSPHEVMIDGERVDADTIQDQSVRQGHTIEVTGRDGKVRKIDMGGLINADGIVYLLASHDESCFKAGQIETKGWVKGGMKLCMDKSEGPSVHFACYCVEYGNGTICLEPGEPAPYPISIKELRKWHQEYLLVKSGVDVPGYKLPATADVCMDPGCAAAKDGWWGSKEFWMQTDLACEITKEVFDVPSKSRFRLVGHIDWSQGHAGMADGALNAENMLCGTGGKTAKHINPTSYPYSRNGVNTVFERKAVCDDAGCPTGACITDFKANWDKRGSRGFNPLYQSIGVKGLVQVLRERGFNVLQKNQKPGGKKVLVQGDLVALLQTCDDFQCKNLITRAHVTDLMASHGYIAFFGVKYHAELAWVERKWMHMKRLIRPRLNGKLPRLKELLKKHWKTFGIVDSWKAARHCRDSMRAYGAIEDADLDTIREEELKMKGHRRVFDGSIGKYMLKAQIQLTAQQKLMALRTERRRLSDLALQKKESRVKLEHISGEKRKALLSKTEDEKQSIKDSAIARKEVNKKKRLDPSYEKTLTLKESIEANEELQKLDANK